MDPTDTTAPEGQDEHAESLFDTEPSPQPPAPAGDRREASREGNRSGAAAIADDTSRSLDPKHIVLQRIVGAIITVVVALNLMIGGPILYLVLPWPRFLRLAVLAAATLFTVGMGWFTQIWPAVEHRHTRYRVNERGIEIRRGVVFRKVITLPRSRVQHTDVAQGPLERRFGLSRLVIYTAGTEHSKVELPGLSQAIASRIRDHLVAGGEDDAV